jgi:hypothetical protein
MSALATINRRIETTADGKGLQGGTHTILWQPRYRRHEIHGHLIRNPSCNVAMRTPYVLAGLHEILIHETCEEFGPRYSPEVGEPR